MSIDSDHFEASWRNEIIDIIEDAFHKRLNEIMDRLGVDK